VASSVHGFFWAVLGRQQEGDSVARRVRVSEPSVILTFWCDDDAQSTDHPSREWKGKTTVEKVNSRCTKQQELGTVKAMPTKGLSFSKGGREQFPNAPPILPFNASHEQQSGPANQLDPVHLASFSLTNFQSRGAASGKGALGISGPIIGNHNLQQHQQQQIPWVP
jgi:hypothetical protein